MNERTSQLTKQIKKEELLINFATWKGKLKADKTFYPNPHAATRFHGRDRLEASPNNNNNHHHH